MGGRLLDACVLRGGCDVCGVGGEEGEQCEVGHAVGDPTLAQRALAAHPQAYASCEFGCNSIVSWARRVYIEINERLCV